MSDIISILCLDDERDILDISRFYLEMDNRIKVITSSDPKTTLDIIRSGDIDIIVSDYQMPGMNGLELLKDLRGQGNDIPFILFTGKGREEVAINALNLGVTFYLQKGTEMASQYAELRRMVIEAVTRRRAEQQIMNVERRYHVLLDRMPLAYGIHQAIFNEDGRMVDMIVLDANLAFEQMTSIGREEWFGRKVSEIMKDETPRWIAMYADTAENGRTLSLNTRSERLGRDYEVLAYRNEPGQFVTVFRDVTDVKAANLASERFSEVIANMGSALLIFQLAENEDRLLRIIAANDAAKRLFTEAPDDLINCTLRDILPDCYVENLATWIVASARSGEADERHGLRVEISGGPRWFDLKTIPLKEGQVAMVLDDVSRMISAETHAHRAERRYQAYFDSNVVGMAVLSPEQQWLDINPRFCEMMGYDREGMMCLTPSDIGHPEDLHEEVALREELRSGAIDSYTVYKRFVREDGNILYGRLLVQALRGEDGRIENILFMLEDVGGEKVAMEALRDSQDQYRMLFSNMEEGASVCRLIEKDGAPDDFEILDMNEIFQKIAGADREELMGRRGRELWSDYISKYIPVIANVVQSSVPYHEDTFFAPLGKYLRITVLGLSHKRFTIMVSDITAEVEEGRRRERQRVNDDVLRRTYKVLAESKRGHVNKSVQTCLGIIGDLLGVDRCLFSLLDRKQHSCELYLEWTRRNYGERFKRDYAAEIWSHEWYWGRLDADGSLLLPNLTRVPIDVSVERRYWNERKVNAVCTVLHEAWDGLAAVLEIQCIDRDRGWSEEEVTMLHSLSRSIIVQLERAKFAQDALDKNRMLGQAFKVGRLGSMSVASGTGDLTWSEEFCTLLDIPSSTEPSIASLLEHVDERDRHILEGHLTALTVDPKELELDIRVKVRDGEVRYFQVHFMPLPQGSGQEGTTLGTWVDLSDERRMKEELRAANAKISLMTSITRHDVMNQISKMNAYIDMEAGRPDTDRGELMDRISRGLKGIENNIRFTKDYKLLGESDPSWQPLQDIVENERMGMELGGIVMDLTIHDVEVRVDPLFRKVISNLMDNSVRHGGHVKKIAIWNRVDLNGDLIITYEDDGLGVADADKERIFEPGYGKHTGYGLYLARQILEISKISIIENGVAGEGARFEMKVPPASYRFKNRA